MWSVDKPFLQLFFRCYQIHDLFFVTGMNLIILDIK